MPHSDLYHITTSAPSLGEGVGYVQRMLGVTPGPSGEYPRMGTHDCIDLEDEFRLSLLLQGTTPYVVARIHTAVELRTPRSASS